MKKISLVVIVILIIVCLIEGYIIVIQKKTILNEKNKNNEIISKLENQDKKLIEEIIIYSYKEFDKAGRLTNQPVGLIISNMKLISNSYIGDDKQVKDMIQKIFDYLNYKMYKLGLNDDYISPLEDKDYLEEGEGLIMYGRAKDAIEICISKYGLFNTIGLSD